MKSHRLSSRRSNVWRGDLVRSHWFESAYSMQRDEVLPLITRLGFDAEELSLEDPIRHEVIENAKLHKSFSNQPAVGTRKEVTKSPKVSEGWVTTEFQSPPWPEAEQRKPEEDSISDEIGPPKPVVRPQFRPLASWSQLRTRLQPLLNRSVVTNRVDEKKLVRRLCRCESISKLPRVIRKKSPEHLHVLADRSERCIPYFADQALVGSQLAIELAQDKCSYFIGESPQWLSKSNGSLSRTFRFTVDTPLEPIPGSSILILGDLGLLDRRYSSQWQCWASACRTWKQQGVTIYALLPFSVEQLPRDIRQLVEPIAWQGNRIDYATDDVRRKLVERIFTACYAAMRLEPGLLREIRSMIPDASDASIESDIWQHRYLQSNHVDGARNDRADIKALLQPGFEKLDKETRRRLLEVQRQYRMANGFTTLWHLEFSNLSPETQRLLKDYREDQNAMVRTVREFDRVVRARNIPDEISDQIVWYAKRASEEALANKKVGKSVRMLRNVYQRERPVHRISRMSELQADGRLRHAVFSTKDRSLTLENTLVGSLPVGLLNGEQASVRSTSRLVEVHVPRAQLPKEMAVNAEDAFWKSGKKPDWVSAFGSDEYGLWCEFQVPRHDGDGVVTQRMRWIKPGTFMMGSDASNQEVWLWNETQHEVTLTRGFWMADTPCTQGLWMGVDPAGNPSGFVGHSHPVEQVSWEDCQAWISGLRTLHPQMQAGLPTEAQWEYACRAGSNGEYCFGDSEKELEKYGWYAKNSGDETHPVAQCFPNAWGLYDVHGNVWEWCQDRGGPFTTAGVIDPLGPSNGVPRVFRGGSWCDSARNLRLACRLMDSPSIQDDFLGFRLLISSQGAEPNDPASNSQVRVKDRVPVGDRREVSFWKSGKKPNWVSAFGRDRYGLWYEFQLPNYWSDKEVKSTDRIKLAPQGFVTQRMRWIKPGTFMMGSDASTKELRWGDETQHEVTLTRGFWIADTPCTQGLWMGVGVSKNPSRFQGFNNPVEQVSWEDCQAWLKRLGDIHPQMQAALPSEAQWEYACRAGSTGAYCFGDSEEELDEYAWYEKNSESTTHPVGRKLPNAWGLFDMHGNVWEWCQDGYNEFTTTSVIDPSGPSMGADRVFRGGGWFYPARHLRSACRFSFALGFRLFDLGFRLLSSALGSEPSEGAMLPEEEPGTERSRIGSGEFEYGFLQSIDLDAVGETTPEVQFSEIAVNAYTSIRVVSDQEGYQFDRLEKPDWAIDFGHDAYGLYSVFEVEPSKKGTPIRQRMRWIPPGRFLMGSPEGKDYGRGNEYPQHEVVITHGYWMFDTPCTQALWTALIVENPSYFRDPERPVEQVTWEDAVKFAAALNRCFEARNSQSASKSFLGWNELSFRLPTEAEWEYACRAGTRGDTYAGDLDLKWNKETKARILDSIAWYGGNSGREYDLQKCEVMDDLKDIRDDERRGGTRKVAGKVPNAWGLYDMLGNVWEWCQDWYGEYPSESVVDPTGPIKGGNKVFRGGRYDSFARNVRSACRFRNKLSHRGRMGFRLLSSAHQAKSTESGEGASRSE